MHDVKTATARVDTPLRRHYRGRASTRFVRGAARYLTIWRKSSFFFSKRPAGQSQPALALSSWCVRGCRNVRGALKKTTVDVAALDYDERNS